MAISHSLKTDGDVQWVCEIDESVYHVQTTLGRAPEIKSRLSNGDFLGISPTSINSVFTKSDSKVVVDVAGD